MASGASSAAAGLDQPDEVSGGNGALDAYMEQQAEVAAMLLDDPDNEELRAIYADLEEVIQLTRELQESHAAAARLGTDSGGAAAQGEQHGQLAPAADDRAAPGTLPPQVAEQIRLAQHRAALSGQGPAAWAVGAKCRAVYSGDGNWYNAEVEAVGADGRLMVVFDGYGTKEEVARDAVQLRSGDDEGGYKGVAAPKRRRVDDSAEVEEMPKWLEIQPGDDDKTRQKKRKLAKAYKSKARFAKLDLQQREKADAWKRFLAGKTKKARAPAK